MSSITQRKELEAKDSKCGFFYGYALVVILGFLYFCSSGIILATATIVNPLMLQDEVLGMNATMLDGVLALRAGARYFSAACWCTDLKVRCSFQHDARRDGSPLRHTRAHLFRLFAGCLFCSVRSCGKCGYHDGGSACGAEHFGQLVCGASWRSDDLYDGHWCKFVIYCTACRERHHGSHWRRLEKRLVSHCRACCVGYSCGVFLGEKSPF